jgi:DNA polymerase-3 subunit alpha
MIAGMRQLRTKKGDQMAFLSVEDMHGKFEVIVFPEVFAAVQDILVVDAQVLIRGVAQKEENAVKIIAEEVIPIDRAETLWTTSVHLTIDLERVQASQLHDLERVIKMHPGSSRGFFHLLQPQRAEAVMALPDSMRIKTCGAFVRAVESVLGYKAVETTCNTQARMAPSMPA